MSRNFAQGAPSVVNVSLTGDGTFDSLATASVDIRTNNVFYVDCSELIVTNGYSRVNIIATLYTPYQPTTGASGALPGKEVTFIFKTATDSSGVRNAQSLIISFLNFNSDNTITYTTSVAEKNPKPTITLISDGMGFSVKSSSYMTSSADLIKPSRGNSLLMIGDDDSSIGWSGTNGATWHTQYLAGYDFDYFSRINGIAWNGSRWIAVGDDSTTTMASSDDDGLTWDYYEDPPFSGEGVRAIAWNDTLKLWIAGGTWDGGTNYALAYSETGDDADWDWHVDGSGDYDPIGENGGNVKGIATSGIHCVAVGWGNGDESLTICTSTDGIAWVKAVTNPFNTGTYSDVYAVATNGNIWVAGGYVSDYSVSLAWSEDNGVNWTASTNNPFNPDGNYAESTTVATNGTVWVAGGYGEYDNGDYILLAYSPNGKDWIDVSTEYMKGLSDQCNSVIWNGTHWFASFNNESMPIFTSLDGIHWEPISENPFYNSDPEYNNYAKCFGTRNILPFRANIPPEFTPSQLAARAERKAVRAAEKEKEEASRKANMVARAAKIAAKKGTRSKLPGSQAPRAALADVSGNIRGSRSQTPRAAVADVSGTRLGPRVGREQRNRQERSRGNRSSRRVAPVEPVAVPLEPVVATA